MAVHHYHGFMNSRKAEKEAKYFPNILTKRVIELDITNDSDGHHNNYLPVSFSFYLDNTNVSVTMKRIVEYRIYSNKRCSTFLIFLATSEALFHTLYQTNLLFLYFFFPTVHFLSVNFPMD